MKNSGKPIIAIVGVGIMAYLLMKMSKKTIDSTHSISDQALLDSLGFRLGSVEEEKQWLANYKTKTAYK